MKRNQISIIAMGMLAVLFAVGQPLIAAESSGKKSLSVEATAINVKSGTPLAVIQTSSAEVQESDVTESDAEEYGAAEFDVAASDSTEPWASEDPQMAQAAEYEAAEPVEEPVVEDSEDVSDMEMTSEEKAVEKTTVAEPAHMTYWNGDIREQKIDDILRNLKIDDAFEEAQSIPVAQQGSLVVAEPIDEDEEIRVMTAQDVLKGVIPSELALQEIDLDFEDTPIGDVLLTLGKTANINIVLDPALSVNRLTLHLEDVTIEEALLLIGNTYDLGFKRVGDSLYITKKEKLRGENLASKVIKLKNISVTEAKTLIAELIDTVNASEGINSLIVVGEPEDILRVEAILAKIDKPQPQVVLEAKIIEVNKDALRDLGVDWSDQVNISYQESGRPLEFDNVETAPDSVYKTFQLARSPINFETIIKMLENQNNAKILSNPRVTTMNDKEAEIFVGDRIPYTVTNVTGGVVTTDVRWVEPGIRLIITPTIIEEDFVVLKVEPEVSFIFTFRGPNDEFPHVKTREATAYVRVKNGEPFVLGGLLSQEDKKNLFKVPMLGDIPLLGNLFSYEKHTVLDTELIITIKPIIVNGT